MSETRSRANSLLLSSGELVWTCLTCLGKVGMAEVMEVHLQLRGPPTGTDFSLHSQCSGFSPGHHLPSPRPDDISVTKTFMCCVVVNVIDAFFIMRDSQYKFFINASSDQSTQPPAC